MAQTKLTVNRYFTRKRSLLDELTNSRSNTFYVYKNNKEFEDCDDNCSNYFGLVGQLIEDDYLDYDEACELESLIGCEAILDKMVDKIGDADILYKGEYNDVY